MVCFAQQLAAQTSKPAVAADSVELESIRKTSGEFGAGRTSTTPQKPTTVLETQRVILGLGAVLALIFVMRWVGKRFFPTVAGSGAGGAVRVLSRSPITPKQQVVLIQVGQRVLVVSDNGTQMNALSQITDPDEVAHLLGQVSSARNSNASFGLQFGKAERTMRETVPATNERQSIANDEGDREAEEDIEQSSNRDDGNFSEPEDTKLVVAQGELEGLMQKVRGLARQIGR